MADAAPLDIFIGFDSREPDLSDICAYSIAQRTQHPLRFHYLKHRDLRKAGLFKRPWLTRSDDGEWQDLLDNKPFSTEFSHTRFLIPALMGFSGAALFMDADMICLTDIAKVFSLLQPHQAISCVKHQHHPKANVQKMDGRLQLQYFRKNWSSFVLWDCGHPANKTLTSDYINSTPGADLHAFRWIKLDHEIGELPKSYNYISGVSPKLPSTGDKVPMPDVIHYTEGGPWFKECPNVPYAEEWERERRRWLDDGAVSYDEGGFAQESLSNRRFLCK